MPYRLTISHILTGAEGKRASIEQLGSAGNAKFACGVSGYQAGLRGLWELYIAAVSISFGARDFPHLFDYIACQGRKIAVGGIQLPLIYLSLIHI